MSLFATSKAVRTLNDRLQDLSVEVRELKTAHKHLELEWEELYDKVRHQMARMSRRAKLEPEPNGEQLALNLDDASSDLIDPISAKILARRNRQAAPK